MAEEVTRTKRDYSEYYLLGDVAMLSRYRKNHTFHRARLGTAHKEGDGKG